MCLSVARLSLQVEDLCFFCEPVYDGVSRTVGMEDLIPFSEALVGRHDGGPIVIVPA